MAETDVPENSNRVTHEQITKLLYARETIDERSILQLPAVWSVTRAHLRQTVFAADSR